MGYRDLCPSRVVWGPFWIHRFWLLVVRPHWGRGFDSGMVDSDFRFRHFAVGVAKITVCGPSQTGSKLALGPQGEMGELVFGCWDLGSSLQEGGNDSKTSDAPSVNQSEGTGGVQTKGSICAFITSETFLFLWGEVLNSVHEAIYPSQEVPVPMHFRHGWSPFANLLQDYFLLAVCPWGLVNGRTAILHIFPVPELVSSCPRVSIMTLGIKRAGSHRCP